MSEVTQERRNQTVLRIGRLWRGDWTATMFNGRDGLAWLTTAISGSSQELDALDQTLQDIEDSYL
jgi:hypothetical protein